MSLTLFAEAIPCMDTLSRQAFQALAGMVPVRMDRDGAVVSTIQAWVSVSDKMTTRFWLVVKADKPFAVSFSQSLMDLSAPEGLDEDLTDALKELANTIGGNLKGLVSAETALSIPLATIDSNPDVSGVPLARTAYSFGSQGNCAVELFDIWQGAVST